jgi:hypothetical protein
MIMGMTITPVIIIEHGRAVLRLQPDDRIAVSARDMMRQVSRKSWLSRVYYVHTFGRSSLKEDNDE